MNFTWEKFKGVRQKLDNHITITPSYSMGLMAKFITDNNLTEFSFVQLYFDTNNKALGLHFVNDINAGDTLKVLKNSQGNGRSINVKNFFKYYNLDSIKYQGKYDWTKEEDPNIGTLYVILLKENNNEVKNELNVSAPEAA